MKKEEFYFPCANGKTQIRALRWLPEGKVKAVLQIAHGMVEFIDRYETFADYLCQRGFLVTGNDHLGHGGSVNEKEEWGYFGKNGYEYLIADMHTLYEQTKKDHPDVPYFLLGHSMGSFLARYYISLFGKQLQGAIIMGTGEQTAFTLNFAITLANTVAAQKGERYRSTMINALAIGSYNKKWEPSKTHCDWLCKDEQILEQYAKEERCQFLFTVDGYRNLFELMKKNTDKATTDRISKDLPILICSGNDDPVGDFGKAPSAVYKKYKELGIDDVTLKLYPKDRHEILNESDKEKVYEDLYEWMIKE